MQLQVGGYERQVLLRGNGIEVVIITWPPGTRTRKHDHCGSEGMVYVLRGSVFEVRDGTKTQYPHHTRFPEITVGSAHIVGNDSDDRAITLHVFEPELEMTYFEDDPSDIAALAS